jgi:phage baseplate assembly protein W
VADQPGGTAESTGGAPMDRAELERLARQQRLLGWGLAFEPVLPGLDLARDVSFAAGPNGRDLAVVRGVDNLAQSLSVAFTTLLGSNVFDTDFGFDGLNALADPIAPVLARERVRIGVIKVLNRDPRVRRIVDVRLDDGRLDPAGPADDAAKAALRASRTMEVQVQFETVTQDQLSVRLGELPNV